MGLFDFWKKKDYLEDHLVMTRAEVVDYILEKIPMRGIFKRDQLIQLLKDSKFLVLRQDLLEDWIKEIHTSAEPKLYIKMVHDCDDHEARLRRDRAVGRVKHGFPCPEAMGGLAYYTPRWGYHFADWAIVVWDGVKRLRIFDTQSQKWRDAETEAAGGAVFFDA